MPNDEVKLLVAVKPLEWSGDFAHTSFGLFYHVDHATGVPGFVVLEKDEGSSVLKSAWGSVDDAKAAAQADYEQRILSALSAIPSTVSGETVPDGWKLVPVEPTAEMVAAWPFYNHGAGHERAIYAAMLSASPSPANPAETQR